MKEIQFENQRENEEVVLMEKQHPWVLFKMMFVLIIIAQDTLGFLRLQLPLSLL